MSELERIPSTQDRSLKPTYLWARWIFLRIMAFGFLSGFLSLAGQIQGLIGTRGILPAADYLGTLAKNYSPLVCFIKAPTLLWLNAGNHALFILCVTGTAASVFWLFNIAPRMMIAICWVCYLSFVSAARNFAGFQSDGLMLETALLAWFAAPSGFRPGLGERSGLAGFPLFMLRWLLFRLMFESGLVKFLGDAAWRDGSAMQHYYEYAPFPTWIGYFVQQLPPAFHMLTTRGTLFLELIAPFLIFLGRRARALLFFLWTVFQIAIILTGNYTFLNYTAIALGLFLLDDNFFKNNFRFFMPPLPEERRTFLPTRLFSSLVMTYLFYVSGLWFVSIFIPPQQFPKAALAPALAADAFRSANRYGLFGSMTPQRDQVFFEGSNDWGRTWQRYEFKWQPQALEQRPRFMAPHLPRFDWNLWFATLGTYKEYPFVVMTGVRLIEGEPSVTGLFRKDPFAGQPPQMIRFPLERYTFTDLGGLKAAGQYWKKESRGYYAPFLIRHPETGKMTLIPMEDVPESFRETGNPA